MNRAAAVSLLGLWLTLQAMPCIGATPEWALPQLMAELGEVRSSAASFVELRYRNLLTEPLQSSGKLFYVAPDKLQKDTLEPWPGRFLVDGDRLTIEQNDQAPRVISLRQHPEIASFVESIRATMAGDLGTLTRFHAVSLQGTRENWALLLEPRDIRMREWVAEIRIAGQGSVIRSINTRERGGDRTLMSITPAAW